jgi:Cu/Zn superoxide dismutase
MHFHEVGTCADYDHFKMAKGHIMPTDKPHGYLQSEGSHEGNLLNLIVYAMAAPMSRFTQNWSLLMGTMVKQHFSTKMGQC